MPCQFHFGHCNFAILANFMNILVRVFLLIKGKGIGLEILKSLSKVPVFVFSF